MALDAYVGSFNIDSSITVGNDQSVTGVGFEPKVVLFWWSGSTASSDSVSGGLLSAGFGAAASSSSRFSVSETSDDAAAQANSGRGNYNTDCIRVFSDGTPTLDGVADFKSMDSDGFTLTIDDQFGSDWRISYLALGGSDLTDVYLGRRAVPTSTGEYDTTGVGFQPDALITVSNVASSVDSTLAAAQLMLGVATSSSNQGVVVGWTQDNLTTSNTWGYGYNGEVVSDGVQTRESFVEFISDGFTIDHLEGAVTRYYYYICLKGGQYAVGDLTTRTDSNDIEENVGFEPAAVLFFSANRVHSTQDTVTDHNRLSIGAGTSTSNRAVQAISDEDALADTETAYTNQDDAVYAHVVDDAIEALMDIKSIDSDGFTCVMDDTESSSCWVTYLAMGAEEAAGETLSISITQNDSAYDVEKPIIVG